MKQSYTQTPRTMQSATWIEGGQAVHFYPQSRTESAAGVVLAIVIGILMAAALLHFWVSP